MKKEIFITAENTTQKPARRGRPRDLNLEARVYQAAIEIYAETGWDGFNFEKIAKRSGVGKAALYSRWGGRDKLFEAAFEDRWQSIANIDTGTFATDLEELVAVTLERFLQTQGGIVLNMQADARRNEEFRQVAKPFYTASLARMKKIFERAVNRGELPRDLDSDVASLMIHGTISAKLARERMQEQFMTDKQKNIFAKSLVAMSLRAVGGA